MYRPSSFVNIRLKRDLARSIKQGHPWIYKESLADTPSASMGANIRVLTKKKETLGYGFYNPDSPLSIRMYAVGEHFKENWAYENAEKALELRKPFLVPESPTNAFRLFNGEGDGLPGLVCDVYSTVGVIQVDGSGPAAFWDIYQVAEWVHQKLQLEYVIYKPRRSEEGEPQIIIGEKNQFNPEVKVVENGAYFAVNVFEGQKTGFFLDQRDNRKFMEYFSSGKSVLNLFCYTGGFSVFAAYGGSSHVTSVDLSGPAIEYLNKNWSLNDLNPNANEAIVSDVSQFLDESIQSQRQWDLVIVDPPSYAHRSEDKERAVQSYIQLFTKALKVVSPSGYIAMSSCSSHINSREFTQVCQSAFSLAKKRAQILYNKGQGFDHPYGLAMPELKYLKFVLFRVQG